MIEITLKVSGGSDFCIWQLPADDGDLLDVEHLLDDYLIPILEKMRLPGKVTDC